MNKLAAVLIAMALCAAPALAAPPDLSGTWQGGNDRARHVIKIRKAASGWRGDFFNLGDKLGDENAGAPRNGNPVSAITLTDGTVKFSLDDSQGDFEGKLSDDGAAIAGTWKTLYGQPQPLTFARAAKGARWVIDASPHKAQFVTVQPGVKLEVLDWGGSGPPLVFLAGLGGTGHFFDRFAPKFTQRHHVYAITRRGHGASSAPPLTDENYDADRLGDDVLAVIAALKLQKPVLAGHSIAGEELSSIGTRHPDKVAGLIYLDAVYQYSFYNPAVHDLALDTAMVRRDLDRMFDLQPSAPQWAALIARIEAALPGLQTSLKETRDMLKDGPDLPLSGQKPEDLAGNKIFANTRPYGAPKAPVLAIVAVPRRCAPNCDTPFVKKRDADDAAKMDFFEQGNPGARVVRLPHASHFIFRSNEAEVMQDMNSFMEGLQ
jgi:pimeloyl-ACP methyl ester carboxylesterase